MHRMLKLSSTFFLALALTLAAAAGAWAQTPVFCAPPKPTEKDKPEGDNPPKCDKECESCNASPCYAKTGVYTTTAADLAIPTNGLPLIVGRSYESWHGVDGPIGPGWSSNLSARLYYATYLVSAPNTYRHEAVVVMPDGEVYRFDQNADGTFRAPLGRRDTLARAGDGTYTLTIQGTSNRYGFAADGALLTLQDDYGNTLRFTLDALRRVSRVDDDSGTGRHLIVTWNPSGRIGSVQDNAGRTVVYAYNTNGTLAGVTNPAGQTTTYAYEQRRFAPLLSRITDHWGRVLTTVTWDALDRVQTYSEDGETYTMTYLTTANPPRTLKTHSLGGQTLSYDGSGLVTSRGGGTTTFTVDGDVETETDARGRKTRYTYTTGGRIQTVTYNEGTNQGIGDVSLHYTWHPVFTNKLASVEPRLTYSSSSAFHGHYLGWKYSYYDITDGTTGQLAGAVRQVERMAYQHQTNTVLTPDNCPTCVIATFRYDPKGRITRSFDRASGTTTYVYDDTLNQLKITRASNGSGSPSTLHQFDALGRITSTTDPMQNVTSYQYDELDRLTQVTLPKPSATSTLNFTTTYAYDQPGSNPALTYTHATDPNQRVTKTGYDQFGRIVESIDAAGHTTTYAWANGVMTSMTDPNGNVTSYEYDSSRRLKKTTFPEGASESYTYYNDGLMASKTDRAGVTTSFTYDAFARLRTMTTGSLSRSFNYEGEKLESILDNYSGVTETNSFTYDPKTFLPLTDAQGRRYQPATGTMTSRGTINYTWDPYTDRLLTYSVADGDSNRTPPKTTYSYHNDGSVDGMTWDHVPGGNFDFVYNLNGQVTQITFPNGQKRVYTYDNQGRTLSVSNRHNNSDIAYFGYQYDRNWDTGQYTQLGQLTRVDADVPAWPTDNVTTYYTYDAKDQLIKARIVAGTSTERSWTYDAIGNRLTRTVSGSTLNYTYVKNAAGGNTSRLATAGSSSVSHDVNGNMTAFGGTPSVWDVRGRMTQLQGAFNFTYDAHDRRAAVDFQSAKYVYNKGDAVAISYKYNNGYYLADYLFAPGVDEPLARGDYFGVTYYAADAQNSVILLTNPDGTVRNSYRYGPWGEMEHEQGDVVQPFGYTGREFSVLNYAGRAHYYYRARYMMPSTGRFMSEDPLGADKLAGENLLPPLLREIQGSAVNRISNLYAYTNNDPAAFTDPSGLAGCNPKQVEKCMYSCHNSGQNFKDCTLKTLNCGLFKAQWTWCECYPKKNNKCPPCPAVPFKPVEIHKVPNQHGCKNGHWHYYKWNQIPSTCECKPQRLVGGCL